MKKTPLNLQSSRLLVSFDQRGDRYQHSVAVSSHVTEGVCCRSAPSQCSPSQSVGDAPPNGKAYPPEAWPSDPPLQQLVLEEQGTPPKTVALGVGMSGTGHWSLAAEVVDDSTGAIQFDWACRIAHAAERLVSTYELQTSLARSPLRVGEERGEWIFTDGRRFVVTISEGRMQWLPDKGLIAIEPISDRKRPGTHRWRYCFFVD